MSGLIIFPLYFKQLVDLNIEKIKVIGFDADDTLWVNEPFYRNTESKFCDLLKSYCPADEINRQLYKVEVNNLDLYGYGSKAFILSLIETAILISDGKVTASEISRILALGKEQINEKNPLLSGVPRVLRILSAHYRLIVVTKGDLLDQERKLRNSGIGGYFHHIEIMSDKTGENYQKLLNHLDIKPDEFVMVGNSLKSDIVPVIKLGGYAIHVPFHVTWQHEELLPDEMPEAHYFTIENLPEIIPILIK
jgi:putative hydrolase of the HAD superfamily